MKSGRKKTLPTTVLIVILSLAIVGVCLVNLAVANPFVGAEWTAEVPPDAETKPPTIMIDFPDNNTAYRTNSISLKFNVTVGDSTTANVRLIKSIYYKTDLQQENIVVYERIPDSNMPVITQYSATINLTGLSEGNHVIEVNVTERGDYLDHVDACNNHYYKVFEITGFSSVNFTVDTISPLVSVVSLENNTYYSSDLSLNFAVNELVSRVTYSLDGAKNVTVNGNATLNGLSYGAHSLTMYAQDVAGNIGTSETIYFNVEAPFPTALVLTTCVVVVVIVAVGLLMYFKKRKR